MKLKVFSFFSFFVLFCSFTGFTSKDDLVKRKEKLYNDISNTEKLIKKTESNKNAVLSNISLIQKKISLRQELINTINKELSDLDSKIYLISNDIKIKEDYISSLKYEYAQVVYRSYFHLRSNQLLLVIMGSPNLHVAYRRIIFLKQYFQYCDHLFSSIRDELNSLYASNLALSQIKSEKVKMLNQRQSEVSNLNADIEHQKQLLGDYSRKVSDLQKSLVYLRSSAQRIESEIKKILAEESALNVKKSSKESLRLPDASESKFEVSRGKLPWPVSNGVVISDFGQHSHPAFKGIMVNNNGIDISCNCDDPVYSVFDGVVSKIFTIKGSNYALIIRHGNYLTVYQNLYAISVSVGQSVKMNTLLGKTFCSSEENIAVLHFELWHNLDKLDPVLWLSK
jgi:septal ring factor EnvC (AmiA/AmiB activator)